MTMQHGGLTAEQKEIRSTGIGASEAALVLGRSKYGAPIDVFRRKRHGFASEGETLPQKRGRLFEAPILQWYAEDMGVELITQPNLGTRRSKGFPHLLATPDAINVRMDRSVDAKALRWERQVEFGAQGTDDIPDDYLIQLQVQMGVYEKPEGDLAVLFGVDDFRIFHVEFSPHLFLRIGSLVEDFWTNHIETGKPPGPDASESYSRWLSEAFAHRKTKVIREASPEEAKILRDLYVETRALETIEAKVTKARNELRAAIGEDYGLRAPGAKVLWTGGEPGEKTDWKAVAQAALLTVKVLDPKADVEGFIKQHTITRPTARQLRVTFEED